MHALSIIHQACKAHIYQHMTATTNITLLQKEMLSDDNNLNGSYPVAKVSRSRRIKYVKITLHSVNNILFNLTAKRVACLYRLNATVHNGHVDLTVQL